MERIFVRERENIRDSRQRWLMRKLVCGKEEVFEIQSRPLDRTSFSRKADGSTLHAPTKPGRNCCFLL
jgi:hypothetical protein